MQWAVSTDGGQTFSTISGATSASYSFTASSSQNGYEYEAVFTNSQGTATTSAATLTVDYVTVTTNPTSQTISACSTVTFTAAAGGNPPPAVQWELSTDGGQTFNQISGATSTTYSFTASISQTGYVYEAVFANSVGLAASSNRRADRHPRGHVDRPDLGDRSVRLRSIGHLHGHGDLGRGHARRHGELQ